jgi:hypothetical protein
MNICIIGNSHIAALKIALRDGLIKPSDMQIDFWGVRGRRFFDVEFKDGLLTSPGGKRTLVVSLEKYEALNPSLFDALVFHGPPINFPLFLRGLHQHEGDTNSYSAAFLRQGMYSYLERSAPVQLMRQVRTAYAGRILASPTPFALEQSQMFDDVSFHRQTRVLIDGILTDYFAQFDVEYLPQPERTITKDKYTCGKFSAETSDVRPRDPGTTWLFTHMNELYGSEVLRDIFQKLTS